MIKSFLRATAAAVLGTLILGGQTLPMQQYAINDPVLRMRAWTLTAPANWNVTGTMLPPPSCAPQTTPIYRALSPDGNTGAYFLPRFDWKWGGGVAPSSDCLPFARGMSAREFLAFYIKISHVAFIRHAELADYLAQMNSQTPNGFVDTAVDVAGYTVNGRTFEEYLQASVSCSSTMMMGIGQVNGCRATVKRGFAPQGKLEAFKPTFDAMRMHVNPDWDAAWQQAMVAGSQTLSQSQTQRMLYQGQLAGQARMQAHNDYMASAQQGYAQHNAQFAPQQFAKQNNKENQVDFILGCQRILDTNNTQIATAGNCPARETPP